MLLKKILNQGGKRRLVPINGTKYISVKPDSCDERDQPPTTTTKSSGSAEKPQQQQQLVIGKGGQPVATVIDAEEDQERMISYRRLRRRTSAKSTLPSLCEDDRVAYAKAAQINNGSGTGCLRNSRDYGTSRCDRFFWKKTSLLSHDKCCRVKSSYN